MSQHNLLDYSIFKPNDIHNSFNGNNNLPFTFDYAIQQRKVNVTPSNPANYSSFPNNFLPPINASLTQQQWIHEVSQSAIIIDEKVQQVTIPPVNIDSQKTPTHIVSPEAIREALQEEKEEAMGKSDRRPFSQFSSFHALKQRRYSTDTAPFPFKAEEDEEDDEEPKTPFPKQNEIHTQIMTLDTNLDSSKPTTTQQQKKLKRPPNAYLLFNRDMRRKLLSSCPKMTVAEISKEVGDGWKALPDEQKKYYIKQASLLKEEHLKKYPGFIYTRRSKAQLAEDKKFSKSSKRKAENEVEPRREQPKKRTKKQHLNGGQRDPRGRKKKRQKHPFAPKHPMSAYLYYLASVYPKVSSEFPGSTVGPISKSISKTWHAMTPEERLPWTQKAESDKARYAREMQVYMANQVKPEEEDEDEASSQKTFEEEEELDV